MVAWGGPVVADRLSAHSMVVQSEEGAAKMRGREVVVRRGGWRWGGSAGEGGGGAAPWREVAQRHGGRRWWCSVVEGDGATKGGGGIGVVVVREVGWGGAGLRALAGDGLTRGRR